MAWALVAAAAVGTALAAAASVGLMDADMMAAAATGEGTRVVAAAMVRSSELHHGCNLSRFAACWGPRRTAHASPHACP